ncbi:MAG: hypothetical protein HC835_17385 [Oscillatoriales cyanobacterium RM2_1_1]|nr:hypothetical protein [Oscillatoriales cyanobacterium SM2_3_0]NJO47242.1 hypothetical protein [Oscillatoriales cyanobacterium RM2_1_1]
MSPGGLWSKQLQLFLGVHERKLKFFSPEGELVPTLEEAAKAEQQFKIKRHEKEAKQEHNEKKPDQIEDA